MDHRGALSGCALHPCCTSLCLPAHAPHPDHLMLCLDHELGLLLLACPVMGRAARL